MSRVSSKQQVGIAFRFIFALVLVGFVYSRKPIVSWFNNINPVFTLGIWYAAFTVFVLFVFYDTKMFGRRFGIVEAIGVSMISFAFYIVWNQVESPYAAIASGKNPQELPNILLATEDGVVWMFWQALFQKEAYPQLCAFNWCLWSTWADKVRDFTYVLTPLVLSLLAVFILGFKAFSKSVSRVLK